MPLTTFFALFSLLCLIVVLLAWTYLFVLAVASIRQRPLSLATTPSTRFALIIPAHNEEDVMARTVATLKKLRYPADLFAIHIVADHCNDRTAAEGRKAGAVVHERNEGARGSKGAALRWVFQRVLGQQGDSPRYDAVVIFDADTQVDANFLSVMDGRLAQGDQVIQGQHRISNPEDGWFPALTHAMFLIDNRYQNQGRANLGWSAKNMGDSICFRADLLERLGWGEGLTEDYAFRHQLLLDGICIQYEPRAIGDGQAALTWTMARAQRARWLRGAYNASQTHRAHLLREGLRNRKWAQLDGALQSYLPAYSTLTLISLFIWAIHLGLWWLGLGDLARLQPLLILWSLVAVTLFLYPFPALVLERASLRAFQAILLGPVFILWRSWLAISSRFLQRQVTWIRTPHKG